MSSELAAEGASKAPTASEYIVHHLTFWQNKKPANVVDFSVFNWDSLFWATLLGVLTCFFLWKAARKATPGVPGRFQAAVEILVARQRRERPAYANLPPPQSFDEACARVQFIVGGPQTVAAEVRRLGAAVPFSALHVQPRWQGLPAPLVEASIRRFQEEVVPRAVRRVT